MNEVTPLSPPGTIGVESHDTPRLVYAAPYFVQVPLAELIGPAVTEELNNQLPVMVPPYVNSAANAAVQQLAVLLAGSTMTGPLFLSPTMPTAPSQAASKAYVDTLGATYVPEVPNVPAGQTWARQTGQWVPLSASAGLPEAPNDGKLYGRNGQAAAWQAALPLAGGTLTGPMTLFANAITALQPTTLQQMNAAITAATANYLPLAGGTLTGPLVLAANAAAALQPVSLQQMNAATAPLATTAALANYLPLAGGTITGALTISAPATAPTPAAADNSTNIATTAFVKSALAGSGVSSFNTRTGAVSLLIGDITGAGGAPIANPTFTGTVTLPGNAASALQAVTLQQLNAAIPAASSTTPVMDGTAAVGVGTTWARADHVHASDTSRLPLTGGTLSGSLTVNGSLINTNGNIFCQAASGNALYHVSGAAGTYRFISFETNGLQRWQITCEATAESGSNAGSNLYIGRANDSGGYIDAPLTINRATGNVTIPYKLYLSGNDALYSDGNTIFVATAAGAGLLPMTDNISLLGAGANRWTSVWAVNGAIQTSDHMAKRSIEDCDLGLDFIERLHPVSYRWRGEGNDKPRHHGLIAQEIYAALDGHDFAGLYPPEEREVDGELRTGHWGLCYAELVPVLIRALQELRAECKIAMARVGALEEVWADEIATDVS